jgi:uncharacterized membrane protein YfcA
MASPLAAATSAAARRYCAAGAVGLAAGGTLGLVGWGGAQVIKPCLTSPLLGLGCTPLQATATSLFSLSVAVVAGGASFVQVQPYSDAPVVLAGGRLAPSSTLRPAAAR